MSTSWRAELETLLDAVSIRSAHSYAWFGAPSPEPPEAAAAGFTPQAARSRLLMQLQGDLYARFYTLGRASPTAPPRLPPGTPLVAALSEANSGRGCLQEGWTVRSVGAAGVVVTRHGLEMTTQAKACVPSKGLAPGMNVRIHAWKELFRASPGFYVALGDAEGIRDEPADELARVYWNLRAEGAVPLVREATRVLNKARIPFRLKVLMDPSAYARADSGVLYFRRADRARTLRALPAIHAVVAGWMKEEVPAFTRRLAPGLALAEDVGPTESFGQSRCRLVAEAIVRAHERGARTRGARWAALEEVFAQAGVRLDAPHLRPGSTDDYAYEAPAEAAGRAHAAPSFRTGPQLAEASLELARSLGRRLVAEAIWEGERVGWFGAAIDGTRVVTLGVPAVHHVALGPDLYGGASGIALFLGELAAATGDAEAARAARAGAWTALGNAHRLPPGTHRSLHAGWAGIGYVGTRVGHLLGDEGLVRGAEALLARLPDEPAGPEWDLVSGETGAVLALLASARPANGLAAAARRMGDELLERAQQSLEGISWSATTPGSLRNLTGYSHGAAGPAHAFWELHGVTGDPRYAHAAREASRYENAWFDANEGNWPDFRGEADGRPRPEHPRAYATAWCHGAPGIALARIAAYEAGKDPRDLADLQAALATTRRSLDALLAGAPSFCLCHGVAGNADVLREGLRWLEPGEAHLAREVLERAQRMGLDEVHGRGAPWPGGVPNQESPGLMLGLAGVGHFFLRSALPHVPGILALRAGQAARSRPAEASSMGRGMAGG